MNPTTTVASSRRSTSPDPLPRAAAATSAAIAVVYGLLAIGVLDLGAAEPGELGILGAAAIVHLAIAGALWLRPRASTIIPVVLLQLTLGAMYVAIAGDRDPSYEVWGVTIRILSAVLVVLALSGLARARQNARRVP